MKKIPLFLFCCFSCLFAAGQTFELLDLKEDFINPDDLGMDYIQKVRIYKKDLYFVIGTKKTVPTGDEMRLYLYRKNGNQLIKLSESPPYIDGWMKDVSVFASNSKRARDLVLVELGDENCWGLRVFEIRKNKLVERGDIDAAYSEYDPSTGREYMKSLAPFIRITRYRRYSVLEFTRDVVYNPCCRDERVIEKDKILYVIKKNSFYVKLKK